MGDKILSEKLFDAQVIRLTLNAPKGNVLDAEMMTDLQRVLEEIKQQPDTKMIQFVGAGEHFSFGASVAEHTKEKSPEMLKQFHQLFYTLADMALPTMALVSGQCLGGGCELALMCNFIFADKTAMLGQPEISLGVFAPPASFILPFKIGQARTDCMLISGRIIPVVEAEKYGLITQIFDDKEVMLDGADAWIGKNILKKSASSLKFAVRAARIGFNEALKNQLPKLEQLYLDGLMETNDANEGIASFLERRKPDWQNK